MEDARVTEFGVVDVKLLDGRIVKVRPFTFGEKKAYLKLVEDLTKAADENDVAGGYLNMQLEVAFFIVSILNPEITKVDVENNVNGEILKRTMEVAFYDPFAMNVPRR